MKNQSAFNDLPKKNISDLAKDALDDFIDVLASQFRLFRVEVAADVSDAARDVGRIAVFLPIIALGYVFAMTGLAFWLSRWIGMPMAFAGLGLLQLVGGALGVGLSVVRIRRMRVLHKTNVQVTNTISGIKDGMSVPVVSAKRMMVP